MPPTKKIEQEAGLGNDADKGRDPSASETPSLEAASGIRRYMMTYQTGFASEDLPILAAIIDRHFAALRSRLESVERERDLLLDELAKAFDWSDRGFGHAYNHIDNAVSNLRCDLAVEKKLLAASERVREQLAVIAERVAGWELTDDTERPDHKEVRLTLPLGFIRSAKSALSAHHAGKDPIK